MTVHVAPGTYKGAIRFATSGTAGARIRFLSETKWGAQLKSSGAYTTWTNDADYVDIVGFDISGDGFIGILNRGSWVRILANRVHHIAAPKCTSNGGAGIVNAKYTGSDNDIIGNMVHDVGDLTKPCVHVHGIYHANARGRIQNNITYRNQGFGIQLWHAATDVTVTNNLVFANNFGGILVGAGDSPYFNSPAHPADHIIVANNIVIYNQNRFGIEEQGVTGPNNLYANNLVYGNLLKDWKLQTGRQQNCLSEDPHLLNYQANGDGDYHPSSISPTIGIGTSVGSPAFDFEGHARPRAGSWDIGPFQTGTEMKYKWPPPACFPDCDAEANH